MHGKGLWPGMGTSGNGISIRGCGFHAPGQVIVPWGKAAFPAPDYVSIVSDHFVGPLPYAGPRTATSAALGRCSGACPAPASEWPPTLPLPSTSSMWDAQQGWATARRWSLRWKPPPGGTLSSLTGAGCNVQSSRGQGRGANLGVEDRQGSAEMYPFRTTDESSAMGRPQGNDLSSDWLSNPLEAMASDGQKQLCANAARWFHGA